jgi:hypothetical protein
MHLPPETIHVVEAIASDVKFWATLIGFLIAGYKAFDWVKQIRTKDLSEIHTGLNQLRTEFKTGVDGLSAKVDSQTSAIVGELRELRSDFRTVIPMTMAYMSPVQSQAGHYQQKSVPKKPVAKKRTKSTKDLQSS